MAGVRFWRNGHGEVGHNQSQVSDPGPSKHPQGSRRLIDRQSSFESVYLLHLDRTGRLSIWYILVAVKLSGSLIL